jgi:hypothetical protein
MRNVLLLSCLLTGVLAVSCIHNTANAVSANALSATSPSNLVLARVYVRGPRGGGAVVGPRGAAVAVHMDEEPWLVDQTGDAMWLAGAITEVSGMAPEGATGAVAGGHTASADAGEAPRSASCGFADKFACRGFTAE